MLSHVFSYPKATSNSRGGHPTAIYYLVPENLLALKKYLERNGSADFFDDLADLIPDKHDKQFTHPRLIHELGISEFFLTLEAIPPCLSKAIAPRTL